MKKGLSVILLFSTFIFSAYTINFGIKDAKPADIVLQDPEYTHTFTPENTNTPDPSQYTDTPDPATYTDTPIVVQYPSATPTETKSYERPLLYLKKYSYDQYDTYAGGDFSVKSTFQNLGQMDAYNVVITFSSNDLTPTSSGGVSVISSLPVDESKARTQYFAVADDIDYSPATINIDVDYKDANGNSYSQSFTISISIAGYGPYRTATPVGRPQIIVKTYETDLETLQVGSSFLLAMNLQNKGLLTAYNVDMTIGSGSEDGDEIFMPVGTSNIQVIGNVGVEQIVKAKQSFVVSSDAEPGVYPLTLEFTYRDEDGNEFTDEQIISLMVYLVPSIEISFYEDPEPFTVGEEGTLPIQVINIGSDSVLLSNILIDVEDATLSNNWTFIGTLESGGSFTIDTDIIPEQAGTYSVDIIVEYQDNFKNSMDVSESLSITVEGSGFGGGPDQGGNTAIEQASNETPSQPIGQGGEQEESTFWDILLRFIRGMIGFDSSSTTNNRNGGRPQ